jgi:hypothetical protein
LDYEIYGITLIPVIVALVALAKELGLPEKFSPILSMALGIVAILVFGSETWRVAVFQGIICGLAASGLYSGSKSFVEAAQAKKLNGNGGHTANGTKPPNDTTPPQP